jgi:glycosyltransferase involved in cell wall biosynthesis
MEIVAVDDASTDRTVDLLREYERRDARLRVVVNTRNIGFIRNFERAISLCNGVLIAPCDQDDVWLIDKLRTLVRAIGHHSMVYSDSELIDAEGRPLGVSMSRFWTIGLWRCKRPHTAALRIARRNWCAIASTARM